MSQYYQGTTAGGLPPSVPTQFDTDVNSPAIPAGNILNIFGGEISTDNLIGIQTDGSSGGNTVTVQLTNRITGITTTSDGAGQSQNVISFSLGATPATFVFDLDIAAYNITDALSASYDGSFTRRTTGVVATAIGADTYIAKEEGAMSAVVVIVLTSLNSILVNVTGIAGKTIDWVCLLTYVKAT